ncbi:MAG: hypothetical protein U0835_08205 [Isosphaeraceae bacterium]
MSDHHDQPAILHIHGQRYPQDTVEIFGSTPGLERLINALIEAVNTGRGRCDFVVRDGFMAQVEAVCLDGRRREEEWKRSGSPYLDVDDPLVARIIELTEDNARLRQAVAQLRAKAASPGAGK